MAKYELKIGGKKVQVGTTAPPSPGGTTKPWAALESIRVAYEQPRELAFRWYGPNIQYQDVELLIDGVVRFGGKALTRRFTPGIRNNDLVTCYGYEELIKGFDLMSALTFYPEFQTPEGSTLRSICDQIAEGLTLAATFDPDLAAVGLVPTFVGATSDIVPNFHVRGATVGSALSELSTSVPGFTWIIDPAKKTLNIVLVFNAPPITLTVGQDQIDARQSELTESMRDRYSAVRIIGQSADNLEDHAIDLGYAWDRTLEANWTFNAAGQATSGSSLSQSRNANVFRRFSFDAQSAYEMRLDQQLQLLQVARNPDNSLSYISIEIGAIDLNNGFIWSKFPAPDVILDNNGQVVNPKIHGKCMPPVGMALIYKRTIGSQIPGLRKPDSGYTGTANSIYKLRREKTVYLPNEDITLDRVGRMLDMKKDVLYEGPLAINMDVPDAIWNLNARINLAITGGQSTGLENANMILRAFEHNFRAGQTVLELGTDKSAYLGDVAN